MKTLHGSLFLLLSIGLSINALAQTDTKDLPDGLYAVIETNRGNIVLELYYQDAPLTVANFVGLAEGKIPNKAKSMNVPYFNGMTFHRVISNFMIQGGDPNGNGSGDPGYLFRDEFSPKYQFDGPGVLAMANRGPNTNGSQFFITHKETPWLNGKHTIFGHVVQGQDVVNAIRQGDVMKSVTIIRVGADAEAFRAYATWKKLMAQK